MKTIMFVMVMLGAASSAHAASTDGKAKVIVQAKLTIANDRDLDFGTVTQGDAAGTVLASDPTKSADFAVTGEIGKAYTITLPATAIVMKKDGVGGTPASEISVDTFTSNKQNNASQIDPGGSDTFQVGATHAAILANQESGSYYGNFTVDVVY